MTKRVKFFWTPKVTDAGLEEFSKEINSAIEAQEKLDSTFEVSSINSHLAAWATGESTGNDFVVSVVFSKKAKQQ